MKREIATNKSAKAKRYLLQKNTLILLARSIKTLKLMLHAYKIDFYFLKNFSS